MIRVSRTVSSVLTMSKPGVIGTITGAQIATMTEKATSSKHEVEHGRYDAPRAIVLAVREQPGQHRDQR